VIHGRFAALFDGPPTPEAVLALSMETLRSVGLSGSKAASITDLAEKVDAGWWSSTA
jgi:3-methyladenine DNA glycosylase/8-oxoguanine DNA glycosylase